MKTDYLAKIFLLICVLTAVVVFSCYAENNTNPNYGVSVEYGVICRSVVDRVPVSTGDVFPNDVEKLYCFTHIRGVKEPSEVVHQWIYEGEMVFQIKLPVLSPSWRTYSTKKILPHQTGEWRVEIISQSGVLLQQILFTVHGE